MDIYDTINFGQYKGLTVKEIFQGSTELNKDLLKSYLKQRVDKPNNDDDCFIVGEFTNFEISDTLLRVTPILDDLRGNWSATIEGFFKDVYDPLGNWFLGIDSLENVRKQSFKDEVIISSGNPAYIEWCIKEVEDFYLHPSGMAELSEMLYYRFVGINVTHKIEDIYEYKPKFISKRHSFSHGIIHLNGEKYQKSITSHFSYEDGNDEWNYSDDDDYCGGCESSPCRCSDPDPG